MMNVVTSIAPVFIFVMLVLVTWMGLHQFGHLENPVSLLFACFAVFYGLRFGLIALGLDTPYPDGPFVGVNVAEALTSTGSLLLLYATLIVATVALLKRPLAHSRIFLSVAPRLDTQLRIALVLTSFATLVTVYLLLRTGSVQALIYSAKVEKLLAGLYPLRIFASTGALIAAGLTVDAFRERQARLAWLAGCLAALNGGFVLLWGSRLILTAVAAIVLLGFLGLERSRGDVRSKFGRLVTVACVAVSVAYAARVARDIALTGQEQAATAETGPIRALSHAVNGIYLDTALLVRADFPDPVPFRNGADFIAGLAGLIPRALWEGKPELVKPGRWIRQLYEPEAINGWPVGAPMMWYINFGLVGTVLGAVLAGLIFARLGSSFAAATHSGFNIALSFTLAFIVFQTGIDTEFPADLLAYVVPLLACGWWMSKTPQQEGQGEVLLGQSRAPRAHVEKS